MLKHRRMVPLHVRTGQKKKYGHLPIKDVEAHPWHTLCVDLIGPYTVRTKRGTQTLHAMTLFDPATSWFEVVEIPNKQAVTCASGGEHLVMPISPAYSMYF